MNRSQQVWRRYIDAWNRHDVDAILDNVTDDFIYDERPATMDRPLQGRRAFRAYLAHVHSVSGSPHRGDIVRGGFYAGRF
jgi:hypothetical protein